MFSVSFRLSLLLSHLSTYACGVNLAVVHCLRLCMQVLETFLQSFDGCVIVASHDRAFMDSVVDRQFVLDGSGEVALFDGLYSEYLEAVKEQENEGEGAARFINTSNSAAKQEEASRAAEIRRLQEMVASSQIKQVQSKVSEDNGVITPTASTKSRGSKRKMSLMEKKEYERLELEVEQLTKKQESLEETIQAKSLSGDFEALTDLSAQLAKVQAEVDKKTERWLELAEIIE